MRPLKENSLTRKVLNYLANTSENLLDSGIEIMFNPRNLIKQGGFCMGYSKSQITREIHNLKRTQYFNKEKEKVYLTRKGRIKAIKALVEKKVEELEWDGKWRGIIFDIPETNRYQRRLLRKELKLLGFKKVQKSIWIFPYDIEKELKALLRLWKIDFKGDIRFVLIEQMEDRDLREQFELL